MTRLCDGVQVQAWPHGIDLIHPELGVQRVAPELETWVRSLAEGEESAAPVLPATMEPYVTSDEPGRDDPVTAALLVAQSQSFGGWLPGIWRLHRGAVEVMAALQARQRLLAMDAWSRMTLPISTLQRASIIRADSPGCVYLEQERDGLPLLLAGPGRVIARPLGDAHDRWLREEAAAREIDALEIDEQPPVAGSCDAAVIHAGPPTATVAALERALAAVCPGGALYVRVRSPWDEALFALLETMQIEVVEHWREIDHWMVPGGTMVDGAGDLLKLIRPESVVRAAVEGGRAEDVRAQPCFAFDSDALLVERLDDSATDRWLDLIAFRNAAPERFRRIQRLDQEEQGCWFDEQGNGFSFRLHREAGHLMVNLFPFDGALEVVALCSALQLFGDALTRVRPQRTGRYMGEVLFG